MQQNNNKRVLVINPPLRLGSKIIDYPHYTTYGAVSNAAALRAAGFETVVADAFAMAESEIEWDSDSINLGSPTPSLLEFCRQKAAEADAVVVSVSPFLFPFVRTEHAESVFSETRSAYANACVIAADCDFAGIMWSETGLSFLTCILKLML